MSANERQIGGEHYDKEGEQHWDRVYRLHGRGYFVGCATKYIERYHLKNGKQDLEKAIHFIEKLIELEYPESTIHPKKYPVDYQEQLSKKMEKMREDAQVGLSKKLESYEEYAKQLTGIPEHLREEMQRTQRAYTTSLREKLDTMNFAKRVQNRHEQVKYQMSTMPESLQGAISPMLQKYWGSTEEPMSQGYVNQDGVLPDLSILYKPYK